MRWLLKSGTVELESKISKLFMQMEDLFAQIVNSPIHGHCHIPIVSALESMLPNQPSRCCSSRSISLGDCSSTSASYRTVFPRHGLVSGIEVACEFTLSPPVPTSLHPCFPTFSITLILKKRPYWSNETQWTSYGTIHLS